MPQNKNPDIYKDKNTAKAITAAITAFLFLSFVSVLIKLQIQGSAKLTWVVFIQYATCLFITTIIASKSKFQALKTKQLKYHIIRGVTGIMAYTCVTIAMSKIPLVNAVLLSNTTPLFIPVITLIWLKTKFNEKIWRGILVGFIGIIFILQPTSADFLKEGDLYGLASGVFLAIAYVAMKILTKTESFITIIFYYSLIAFLLVTPFAVAGWESPPPIVWGYGILSGIFFMCYMYLLQYAYRFMEAVKLSPFNYSIIVFTGLFDWLLFDHVPDTLSIIGIVLVSFGGILAITLHEKDNKELSHHWH